MASCAPAVPRMVCSKGHFPSWAGHRAPLTMETGRGRLGLPPGLPPGLLQDGTLSSETGRAETVCRGRLPPQLENLCGDLLSSLRPVAGHLPRGCPHTLTDPCGRRQHAQPPSGTEGELASASLAPGRALCRPGAHPASSCLSRPPALSPHPARFRIPRPSARHTVPLARAGNHRCGGTRAPSPCLSMKDTKSQLNSFCKIVIHRKRYFCCMLNGRAPTWCVQYNQNF